MQNKEKQVLSQMYEKLYSKENRQKIEHTIARLKSELENLAGVDAFVTARVKSPISIIKKFQSEDVYREKWNNMKDLIGLMVVVEKNSDVDDIIFYLENEYSKFKNPNSKRLYKDYRKVNIRGDHDHSKAIMASDLVYDAPSDKNYQICDGYKNVRVNLMIDEYPIEIQIKTKEQYVAHEATHDPVYKAPSLENADIRQMISDKLFPYFEANAHFMFHENDMSAREKYEWMADINAIIDRNGKTYQEYRDIYEDACRVYALYLFMTSNMKEIYKDATVGNSSLDLKLLEIEVKRIFHYLEKDISSSSPSLTSAEIFSKTIKRVANLSYDEFTSIRKKIAGDYRCEKCIVSGVYDLLRGKDVELIKRLSESFREVEIGVYDDELAEIFTCKPPMFTLEERKAALRMIRGVSSIRTIGIDGKLSKNDEISFMSLNPIKEKKIFVNYVSNKKEELLRKKTPEEIQKTQVALKPKQFKIGYLPGVFDMLHPGHIEYIKQVCELCEIVYIAPKSDQYVIIIKNKIPVLYDTERRVILKSFRSIEDVVFTEFDITPPENILEHMEDEIKEGNQCAIFMGSDWIEKPDKKTERSLNEYDNLVKNHPNISLVSIPRGNSGRSSTHYRERGLQCKEEINPYEFTILNR